MTIITANFTAIETGLYSKLTAAAGTAVWGLRVYADQAAFGSAGTVFPYVVFFQAGGGDENECQVGGFDVLYQVECWGTALAQARLGQTTMNTLLHYQTLTISGATNYWTVQRDLIRSVENEEGRQFWRRGATYQIKGG